MNHKTAADDEVMESASIVRWLTSIERSRDLTLHAPSGTDAALHAFVDGLRGELHAFRAIVEAAGEAVDLNARQLVTVVANTSDERAMIERTASAVSEMDRSAHAVADAGEGLRSLVDTMSGSSRAYETGVERVLDGLDALAGAVASASGFATAMDDGTAGISAFLERLRRLARQARLLAINAAIEAAHLGESGRGFVIVAEEVKKLSSSTADSANSVAAIERQLHEASSRVGAMLHEAAASVHRVGEELGSARGRSESTRRDVEQLAEAIAEVATIAGQQSAALAQIAQGVEAVAGHAGEINAAAERAAELALGDALARLRTTMNEFSLGPYVAPLPAADLAHLPQDVVAAASSLRARVDRAERDLLEAIVRIAVSVARNSYEWKGIGDGMRGLRMHLGITASAMDQMRTSADAVGEATARMRASLGAIRDGFAASLAELEASLGQVERVREAIAQCEADVAATAEAGGRALAILDLIDAISGDTTLLALNAAIEAAHAGLAGSGFGIIADEIRHLADTTGTATQEIGAVLGGVGDASRAMSQMTGQAVAQTDGVRAGTGELRGIVDRLRGDLETTLLRAAEVAQIADQQLLALADVRGATAQALGRLESDASIATDERRLELANLGMRAHGLAARRTLGTVAEEMRVLGAAVAAEMDAVFDAAIERREITLDDCFDTGYVKLEGERVRELGRLFDVSKVPAAGFDPPKFRTRYDKAVEAGINAIIDRWVPQYPSVKAMFAVDLNGFCFGHYHECRRDWTGDYVTDLNHNRIKRFFEDTLSLRCARGGLDGRAGDLPARTPRAAFRSAGCDLHWNGERPWVLYTYARDTGIVYNDLSVAIFAQGNRVGTIRIIYDADAV